MIPPKGVCGGSSKRTKKWNWAREALDDSLGGAPRKWVHTGAAQATSSTERVMEEENA